MARLAITISYDNPISRADAFLYPTSKIVGADSAAIAQET